MRLAINANIVGLPRRILFSPVLALLLAVWSTAASHAAPDLYFGPGAMGGLYRVDLDNLNSVQQIVQSHLVNTSTGIAIDYFSRQLYWIADTQFGSIDKIRRSNLDGTNVETFFLPAGQPAGLKIDPFHRRLYWTSRITNSLDESTWMVAISISWFQLSSHAASTSIS